MRIPNPCSTTTGCATRLRALRVDVTRLLRHRRRGDRTTRRKTGPRRWPIVIKQHCQLGETVEQEHEQLQGLILDRPVTSARAPPSRSAVVVGFIFEENTRVNTENVVKHLRVLWRTDRIIADIERSAIWRRGLPPSRLRSADCGIRAPDAGAVGRRCAGADLELRLPLAPPS